MKKIFKFSKDYSWVFSSAFSQLLVGLLLLLTLLWGSNACMPRDYPLVPAQLMPAESYLHERTWMAYGATISAWGDDTTTPAGRDYSNSRPVARHDLIRIAAQLSRFETVNMLVNSDDKVEAETWLSTIVSQKYPVDQLSNNSIIDKSGRIYIGPKLTSKDIPPILKFPINFIVQPVNDLWARDDAPLFVKDVKGIVSGVNFNFNGWGQQQSAACLSGWVKENKPGVRNQDIEADVKVASFINNFLKINEIKTWVTMEGGGVDVNGRGLAIATESCILNTNRNPGKTKAEVEIELQRVIGIEKMMWIPGTKAMDITDGHVDFNVRFTAPNRVVYFFDPVDDINLQAFQELANEINAWSPELKLKYLGSSTAIFVYTAIPLVNMAVVKASIDARNPNPIITTRDNFATSVAASYAGFYEANGCVIMGQFGDPVADQKAFDIIQAEFPSKVVIQITTDGVANAGGSIHCSTQQQMPISPNSTTTSGASSYPLNILLQIFTLLLLVVGMISIA